MHRNILVVLTLKEWSRNGDCLRIENIFGRLKKNNYIHALFLDTYNNEGVSEHIKPYFSRVTHMACESHETFAGRMIKFLALKPYFVIEDSDRALSRRVRDAIATIIREEKIDIVHAWHTCNSQFVESVRGVAVLHDICDSAALTFKNEGLEVEPSLRNWLTFQKMRRYERCLVRNRNTCFVSPRDPAMLGVPSGKSFIIPNGVDTEHFLPARVPAERHSIVFSGVMCFRPNVQAVLYFYRDVFPALKRRYPDVRWYIVGGDPAEEVMHIHDGTSIIVTGFVDDIRAHVSKAEVVICPMVSGLGIKNKVLEAMALAKPIVSTGLGISGIRCQSGKDVLVACSADEFIRHIDDLFRDESLRSRIGANARDLVVKEYSWDRAAARYDAVYDRLTKG